MKGVDHFRLFGVKRTDAWQLSARLLLHFHHTPVEHEKVEAPSWTIRSYRTGNKCNRLCILHIVERLIVAFFCNKCIMSSLLNNYAILNDNNSIRIFNG